MPSYFLCPGVQDLTNLTTAADLICFFYIAVNLYINT